MTRRRERPAPARLPETGKPGPLPDPAPAGMSASSRERSAHRLYVQVAWTTLDGMPLIAADVRPPAEARLISLCRRLDAEPVAVRVTASSVRLLLRLTPSHSVATLVTALKLGSQDALTLAGRPVRWARGYAASSVGPSEVRGRVRQVRAPGEPPRRGA